MDGDSQLAELRSVCAMSQCLCAVNGTTSQCSETLSAARQVLVRGLRLKLYSTNSQTVKY